MSKRKIRGPEWVPYKGLVLQNYVWRGDDGITWRPNTPFKAALEIVALERGRSAAHFLWRDGYGREFVMFIADALELMRTPNGVKDGKRLGYWLVVKRGANYGIALLRPEEMGESW